LPSKLHPTFLSDEELAAATSRYSTAADLRKLLTHDATLGGVPIKLLSARWLLTFFQAEGNEGARLEHRQQLEREHPEAFVAGEALERLLAEVDSASKGFKVGANPATNGVYMSKVDGEYQPVKDGKWVKPIEFPSVAAMSHMWLDPSHPDPEAKNLRTQWLPALEWYYSERVRQLTTKHGDEARAKDASGAALSDEAVLAAADFGVFIDLTAMCQKEEKEPGAEPLRTETETALFKFALGSLDVIYALKCLASLLSTRLPEGVDVLRGYEDRGWCCFERALGQLIKAHTICIDIGRFSVDEACKEYRKGGGPTYGASLRIGGARFAERTVAELAKQGSYESSYDRGMLGELVGAGRRAPLTPAAFAEVLRQKTFTSGADAEVVVELYAKTARALLGSVRELEYRELKWTAADYAQLGEALRYCGVLEKLVLWTMDPDDADAAAILEGLALPKLARLYLYHCKKITALPDVSGCAALKMINLEWCFALRAMPDLSSLEGLKVYNLRSELARQWEANGRKACAV
jgi:hypothetical protein